MNGGTGGWCRLALKWRRMAAKVEESSAALVWKVGGQHPPEVWIQELLTKKTKISSALRLTPAVFVQALNDTDSRNDP